MQICAFINTSKKGNIQFRWRFISAAKKYNMCSTLDILCIFAYYMHSMHFCTFKILHKLHKTFAQSSAV